MESARKTFLNRQFFLRDMACCEMCGRNVDSVCRAVVEGSILNVCSLCSRFGAVLNAPAKTEQRMGQEKAGSFYKQEDKYHKQPIEEKLEEIDLIAKGYGEKIKKARERKGLTQEELAKAIAEKESVIQRVEAGQSKPTLLLAKRLQQFLCVEIIEKYGEEKPVIDFKRAKEITIGDLWEMEKEKKKREGRD